MLPSKFDPVTTAASESPAILEILIESMVTKRPTVFVYNTVVKYFSKNGMHREIWNTELDKWKKALATIMAL